MQEVYCYCGRSPALHEVHSSVLGVDWFGTGCGSLWVICEALLTEIKDMAQLIRYDWGR
jgi:hypothetical protein